MVIIIIKLFYKQSINYENTIHILLLQLAYCTILLKNKLEVCFTWLPPTIAVDSQDAQVGGTEATRTHRQFK
jgi:hypothetical protein